MRPDIVLLDLMLPKISGLDVCRTIRGRSSVPIIMVTAKGTEIDTVVALEVGADDYVTKPYRLRELVARMRAVLRRAPGGTVPATWRAPSIYGSDGTWEVQRDQGGLRPTPAPSSAVTRSTCGLPRSSSCCASWWRTPGRVPHP